MSNDEVDKQRLNGDEAEEKETRKRTEQVLRKGI